MVINTEIHTWQTPEDKAMCNSHPTWNDCTISLLAMLREQGKRRGKDDLRARGGQ